MRGAERDKKGQLYTCQNVKIEVVESYRAAGLSFLRTGLPEMNKKNTSYGCKEQKHNTTLNTNEAKIWQYTTTTLTVTLPANMTFLRLQ
jgi:membrane-bound inhibitor of C-type lysozyme